MNYLKSVSLIIFSACLFMACSNKNSNTTTAASTTSSTNADNTDGIFLGDNSLEYTIDGKHVSIKDLLQKGSENLVALYLNKVNNNTTTGMLRVNMTNEISKEVFNFNIANSGTTTILHYSPSLSNFSNKKNNEAEYMSPKYQNYYGDSVTVTITEINASHVTGKFSGRFLSGDDKPVALEITDGSFNLLYTKEEKN